MKAISTVYLLCVVALFGLSPGTVIADSASPETSGTCVERAGSLVSAQGRIERNRAGTADWQEIATNTAVCRGDTLRVSHNSRAALLLDNDTVIRLDQGTALTLDTSPNDKPLLIKLLQGILYYFSIKPRSLELDTPFVNGAVEGTEFLAAVTDRQTQISVLEGQVLTRNSIGSVTITSGQKSTTQKNQQPMAAPLVNSRELLQWTFSYPPLLDLQQYLLPATQGQSDTRIVIGNAVKYFFDNDLYNSLNELDKVAGNNGNPEFYKVRASLLLSAGRVGEAKEAIQSLRTIDKGDSCVPAFLAVIALLDGKLPEAEVLAREALAIEPKGSAALVAMSYVQQASFQLDDALVSITTALQSHPHDGLLLSRLAELTQSLDNTSRKAIETAELAVRQAPNLAYPYSILGFAHLNRMETALAGKAFQQAIALDQAAPLPRLGLGLVEIYNGNLTRGRNLLSIAVSLNPGNSLLRSYLGKAYYEEHDLARAKRQLQIAQDLDPNDPTPFFYSAIISTKENKPGEALLDLQKSIALNDNRAIFRSRLMLDSDLAARSVDTGRVFNELGFSELARNYGANSLALAPADYSSHRLLADSYATMPRHELARVSELLQSQLLQPENIRPIQPQLAEAHMQILEGSGPSVLSSHEYNPLFHRNTVNLLANGVVGGNHTLADDLVAFGVYDKFSFSLGQYYYTTDGFRDNNDLDQHLYNGFAQYRFSPATSMMVEYRDNEKDFGDRTVRFDPNLFNSGRRQKRDIDSWRIGGRHELQPGSAMIGTIVTQRFDDDFTINDELGSYSIQEKNDNINGELQHLYSGKFFRSVIGGSHNEGELQQSIVMDGVSLAIPETVDSDYASYYGYGYFPLFSTVTLTTVLNYSRIDNGRNSWQVNRVSPKMGLTWQPVASTSFRLAWLEGVTRTLLAEQTIEPTQVAGFNQFYDDTAGTATKLYGLGLDHQFFSLLYGGMAYVHRDLEVPYIKSFTSGTMAENSRTDWQEQSAKIYLNWLPDRALSVSTEYLYEKLDRNPEFFGPEFFETLATHRGRMRLTWFDPSGLRAKCVATYANQWGTFVDSNSFSYQTQKDSDSFWIIDASIGYQLPKGYGLINVQLKNLFNTDFNFLEIDPDKPEFSRGRLLLLQFSKSF
jgi:Flp pilus assembly protein TadD